MQPNKLSSQTNNSFNFNKTHNKGKSIYLTYLLTGKTQVRDDILSSMSRAETEQEIIHESENDTVEYEYSPAGTTLKLKRKLYMLRDVYKTDLEKWISSF
jgi:hypothetical protein